MNLVYIQHHPLETMTELIFQVLKADIIARISPFGHEDAPTTTSPLLRDSVMANAHSDEDVVADTSAEREKKKRPRRNWESVNVAITWNDVPSYVKELSRTNDHISCCCCNCNTT